MTPLATASLDLDKSNKSTPIQDSKAQLSGPPIPGVQMSEVGNRLLIASIASISLPGRSASWGASIMATIEGSSEFSNSPSS